MSDFGRCNLLLVAALALLGVAPAAAQENVEADKTPAQLYASDCAICHKSAQGLAKAGGLFGLSSFLREHYTASRESAAAIAQYLKAIDRPETPSSARKRKDTSSAGKSTKKPEKPEAKTGKPDEKKSAVAKPPPVPPEAKPSQGSTPDSKSAGSKPTEDKAADGKPPAASSAKSGTSD